MASFAKIQIYGNLGADAETKYTPNGAMVVELRLAVNPRPRGQNREPGPATWYRVSAWDRQAETLDRLAQQGHLVKGRSLYVTGSFEPRQYTTSDGREGVSYDVRLSEFEFVGGDRRDGEEGGGYGGGNRPAGNQGGNQYRSSNQDSSSGYASAPRQDDDPSMDDVPF